jgi:His-Xaa-Ser system radical SAM maturase HxsC
MRLFSKGTASGVTVPTMGKLTRRPIQDLTRRGDYIVFGNPALLEGFEGAVSGYAGVYDPATCHAGPGMLPTVSGAANLDYLADEDVVLLLPSGGVNVLYRRHSKHNTILTTERCNSYCLMCSQPPRDEDDSHRVGEILRLLELVSPDTGELGLSGGEPTLLGDDLLRIIRKAATLLPRTAVHMLTNGRRFSDPAFARAMGDIGHPDLMLGIPVYSDLDYRHDYVVQKRGAFDETIAGIYNLAEAGVRIEVRVVLHRQTYDRLPELADFLYRNMPFVSQVALMGLEMFGFTHKNLAQLWIDPTEYAPQLEEAVLFLATRGINVAVYNHQLCTIPRSVWPFARKSISDWKNVYLDACGGCSVRDFCGGFFQSATKRHSAHIRALSSQSADTEQWLREWHGLAEEDAPAATAAL